MVEFATVLMHTPCLDRSNVVCMHAANSRFLSFDFSLVLSHTIAAQKSKKNEKKATVRPVPRPKHGPGAISLPANMPNESELSRMFEAFLVWLRRAM